MPFSIAFWFSIFGNPLNDLALLRRAKTAQGEITSAEEDVGDGDLGQAIWTHRAEYAFKLPDGRQVIGSFEGSGRLRRDLTIPLSVEIEYLPENPTISRVKGMGAESFPGWIMRTLLSFAFLTMAVAPGIKLLTMGAHPLSRQKELTLPHP